MLKKLRTVDYIQNAEAERHRHTASEYRVTTLIGD